METIEEIKKLLMSDVPIVITEAIRETVMMMLRDELIMGMVHKDMKSNNKKIHESFEPLRVLSDGELVELYLYNIENGDVFKKR